MAEKEYIERNNVISHKRPFTEFDEGGWSCKVQAVAVEDIQNIPAADVAPVRHGHWIYQSSRKYINTDINEEKLQKEILGYGGRVILNLQCSVCRKVTMVCNSISYEYCPKCGAKMDGDKNAS